MSQISLFISLIYRFEAICTLNDEEIFAEHFPSRVSITWYPFLPPVDHALLMLFYSSVCCMFGCRWTGFSYILNQYTLPSHYPFDISIWSWNLQNFSLLSAVWLRNSRMLSLATGFVGNNTTESEPFVLEIFHATWSFNSIKTKSVFFVLVWQCFGNVYWLCEKNHLGVYRTSYIPIHHHQRKQVGRLELTTSFWFYLYICENSCNQMKSDI